MTPNPLSDPLEEELFQSLIVEAQFVPVDSKVFEEGQEVKWLNMDLAQAGQRFFQKHYTSLILAHSLYGGFQLGMKPITAVVMKAGGISYLKKAVVRMQATLWYVTRWYEEDIIGRYAPGFKAIASIRITHEAMRRRCGPPEKAFNFTEGHEIATEKDFPLRTALLADLKFLDTSTFERMDLSYNPPEHMSQFAMAMTQLTYVLPAIVDPQTFGIYDEDGFKGFEHYWALIGHLSGVDDRYNIPLQRPSREFYTKFWKEVIVPSFLERDGNIDDIQTAYFSNAGGYLTQFSTPGAIYFMLRKSEELKEFQGKELKKLLDLHDWLRIFVFGLIFTLFAWSTTFMTSVNWVVRKIVRKRFVEFERDFYRRRLNPTRN